MGDATIHLPLSYNSRTFPLENVDVVKMALRSQIDEKLLLSSKLSLWFLYSERQKQLSVWISVVSRQTASDMNATVDLDLSVFEGCLENGLNATDFMLKVFLGNPVFMITTSPPERPPRPDAHEESLTVA